MARPRGLGRGYRLAIGVAAVLVAILFGVWIERRRIAGDVIDRTLAADHVTARYRIAGLGLGRQRLTDVVIGDPAHPDLVADWIETRTAIGLDGATLTGLRAGHVRLRGVLKDGTVSLGAIDKLLPAPSGKPFALPAIDLAVADGRMRLVTPYGVVGLKLRGAGRLDDGFAGTLAAVAPSLAAGGCDASGMTAALAIRITKARPNLSGPVRAARAACGGVDAAAVGIDLDTTLGPAFDRWTGHARIATGRIATGRIAGAPAVARAVAGNARFDGTAARTTGAVDLTARDVSVAQGGAATARIAGGYSVGRAQAFDGRFALAHAHVAPGVIARVSQVAGRATATPVAPLASELARAVRMAAADLSANGRIAFARARGVGSISIADAQVAAASGARATLTGGSGIAYAWPQAGLRIDTTVATGGGGIPSLRLALRQARAGAPLTGRGAMARYAAGGASLTLDAIDFRRATGGMTRVATNATLSGPIGDGRVEALSLPIVALWDGAARLTIDPGCVPVRAGRLAVSGLTLDRFALQLCPVDGGLVRLADGRVGGGARVAVVRLGGRLGSTPVAIAARDATLRIGERGFAVDGLETRIGTGERTTRLDFATIAGRFAKGGLAGRFDGGAGQIANVPLLLSKAEGLWRLDGGALGLTGTLGVSDAGATPRFRPMVARDVALGLRNGRIGVSGVLYEPTRDRKVAEIAIGHNLATGVGSATIDVPALEFDDAFQPDLLTPVVFGVIADVKGDVTGQGRIDWSPAGVRSTGTFGTEAMDLAAAFGPVTGLATKIRFTDLLSLQSAPGQIATVKSINPGIAVTDGRIVYQTYPDARVLVDSGRWPFAGGTLTLDPTLLDFADQTARRMTFRVAGAAADQFLQQFDFSNIDATGVFDGTLPMIFDASGGRIANGTLAVRPGGGTLAYVGDLSQKDLGFWGNLAFQALRSLRYRSLAITLNGPLSGEMVTEVRFAGISQGKGAKSNFLIRRLQKLPFVFNIRIRAPFRGLLDSAQSFYDPKRLIQRNLPALLEQQSKQEAPPPVSAPASPPTASAPASVPTPAIQPPASRTVP